MKETQRAYTISGALYNFIKNFVAYVLAAYGALITNNGLNVRLGADGSLNIKTTNTTHLIVDCVGIFRAAFSGGK